MDGGGLLGPKPDPSKVSLNALTYLLTILNILTYYTYLLYLLTILTHGIPTICSFAHINAYI